VVEHLPSKCQALSSNSSTTKKEEEEVEEEKEGRGGEGDRGEPESKSCRREFDTVL
jgi:hypothetical protein